MWSAPRARGTGVSTSATWESASRWCSRAPSVTEVSSAARSCPPARCSSETPSDPSAAATSRRGRPLLVISLRSWLRREHGGRLRSEAFEVHDRPHSAIPAYVRARCKRAASPRGPCSRRRVRARAIGVRTARGQWLQTPASGGTPRTCDRRGRPIHRIELPPETHHRRVGKTSCAQPASFLARVQSDRWCHTTPVPYADATPCVGAPTRDDSVFDCRHRLRHRIRGPAQFHTQLPQGVCAISVTVAGETPALGYRGSPTRVHPS
jgi:hypothetical protein